MPQRRFVGLLCTLRPGRSSPLRRSASTVAAAPCAEINRDSLRCPGSQPESHRPGEPLVIPVSHAAHLQLSCRSPRPAARCARVDRSRASRSASVQAMRRPCRPLVPQSSRTHRIVQQRHTLRVRQLACSAPGSRRSTAKAAPAIATDCRSRPRHPARATVRHASPPRRHVRSTTPATATTGDECRSIEDGPAQPLVVAAQAHRVQLQFVPAPRACRTGTGGGPPAGSARGSRLAARAGDRHLPRLMGVRNARVPGH